MKIKALQVILLFLPFLFGCKTTIPPVTSHKASFYQELDTLPSADRIKILKEVIEKNPTDAMAHYWFLRASIPNRMQVEVQYRDWMNRFPKVGEIPQAIGSFYQQEHIDGAKQYLEKAIEIDPKLGDAWLSLYLLSMLKTEEKIKYLERGKKANPRNAELAYRYAQVFKESDEKVFRRMLLDLSKKFPNDEYGAKALNFMAITSQSKEEKIKYYELLKLKFSPEKFRSSSNGMVGYFNFLLKNNLDSATALVKDMNRLKIKFEHWDMLLLELSRIAIAKSLIEQNKGDNALTVLNTIKFPLFAGQPTELLSTMKALANEGFYNSNTAYVDLIKEYAQKPFKSIYTEIMVYGLKLNKDTAQVKKDIINFIRKNAVQATAFQLKKSLSSDSVNLQSFKGDIVLLTYWFPTCGPCRAEFPYFERAIQETASPAIKYLAVNVNARESGLIKGFLESRPYTFTSLEETKHRDKGNLDNMGKAPMNFLIDPNGYLIFQNFNVGESNIEDLKIMFNLLL